MARQIVVASLDDLPEGSMKTVQVQGKRIALAHVDGEWYAIDDTCSHAECSLGTEGFIDSTTVICGCHGAQFDVTSGAVLSLPATSSVASYPVTIVGSDVCLTL
jgi:3-phenylpropionate/trans-cinnamate dioxygenase ferredoxin subunit